MRKVCVLLIGAMLFSCAFAYTTKPYNPKSRKDTRYDYIYMNPPRRMMYGGFGRYIYSTSGVRYTHSPSMNKRAAHAARINAYNYEQMNNY